MDSRAWSGKWSKASIKERTLDGMKAPTLGISSKPMVWGMANAE